MLIITHDTVSDLPMNSFTSHISIDNGMEPNRDSICLLAAVSGTDDKEMLANVAKGLDYQPLALVSAARYVRQDCESNKEPQRAWAEFLQKLGTRFAFMNKFNQGLRFVHNPTKSTKRRPRQNCLEIT